MKVKKVPEWIPVVFFFLLGLSGGFCISLACGQNTPVNTERLNFLLSEFQRYINLEPGSNIFRRAKTCQKVIEKNLYRSEIELFDFYRYGAAAQQRRDRKYFDYVPKKKEGV